MSSRNGMSRADIDTHLLHDPKIVALARRLKDEQRTCTAVVLYVGAVLASWRDNRALLVVETAPAWMITTDVESFVVELIAVKLLTDEGRVPETTLDNWMASSRAASERGREAADRRWKPSGGNASAMRRHSGRNASAMPVQPSVLPTGNARASREKTDPRPLAEIVGAFDDIVAPDKRDEKGAKT